MAKLVLLNKPYDVLCQFSDADGRQTLADFIDTPELKKVYPAGRLDRDSEGLVLLTDNGALQHQISHPNYNKTKTYWVQVEGEITDDALQQLRDGVELKDGLTRPASATRIEEPTLWPRSKPVRFRANIPTSWIELNITEGKNRQVRRMTAAVGFPTLRLVRMSVDKWHLEGEDKIQLQPGEYRVLDVDAPATKPASTRKTGNRKTQKKHGPRSTKNGSKTGARNQRRKP